MTLLEMCLSSFILGYLTVVDFHGLAIYYPLLLQK